MCSHTYFRTVSTDIAANATHKAQLVWRGIMRPVKEAINIRLIGARLLIVPCERLGALRILILYRKITGCLTGVITSITAIRLLDDELPPLGRCVDRFSLLL